MRDDVIETMARGLCEFAGYQPDEKMIGDLSPPLGWMTFRNDALSLIRALESAGLKIVGREATEGMLDALKSWDSEGYAGIWDAAFDAAPLYGEVGE